MPAPPSAAPAPSSPTAAARRRPCAPPGRQRRCRLFPGAGSACTGRSCAHRRVLRQRFGRLFHAGCCEDIERAAAQRLIADIWQQARAHVPPQVWSPPEKTAPGEAPSFRRPVSWLSHPVGAKAGESASDAKRLWTPGALRLKRRAGRQKAAHRDEGAPHAAGPDGVVHRASPAQTSAPGPPWPWTYSTIRPSLPR
jgi:hypothetical protein